jgi:hypothetical protein
MPTHSDCQSCPPPPPSDPSLPSFLLYLDQLLIDANERFDPIIRRPPLLSTLHIPCQGRHSTVPVPPRSFRLPISFSFFVPTLHRHTPPSRFSRSGELHAVNLNLSPLTHSLMCTAHTKPASIRAYLQATLPTVDADGSAAHCAVCLLACSSSNHHLSSFRPFDL